LGSQLQGAALSNSHDCLGGDWFTKRKENSFPPFEEQCEQAFGQEKYSNQNFQNNSTKYHSYHDIIYCFVKY
jgi:hypothetical protein